MKPKAWIADDQGNMRVLRGLRIQVGGKVWVYDRHTEATLWFKPAPMGCYAGYGNYLKQWRKRNKFTQADAAREFGLSQSLIARVEAGTRTMPFAVFERICMHNQRTYGRK